MNQNDNVLIGSNGNSQIDSVYQNIENNIDKQNLMVYTFEEKNRILIEKQQIQNNLLKEIEDKEKLLLTRSRMLQISHDRNVYKKKIIYSLLAFIFMIFIGCLVMYVLFIRNKY